MWSSWLGASAAGGAVGSAVIQAMPFLGWLFVFGLLVGAGQAVLVWRWLAGPDAALLWAVGSFGGWAVGGIASAMVDVLRASQDVFLAFPWVVLGLGQAVVLGVLVHRHAGLGLATLAGTAWILAAALGGVLFSALVGLTNSTGIYDSFEQAIGVLGVAVARYMLFTAVLYGVPTAAILAWLSRTGWHALSNDQA